MRVLWSIALACISATTYAAPFQTVDQSPLLNGFNFAPSVPARLPSRGTSTLAATLNWSSTAIVQDGDTEALVVDAESREWRVAFDYAPTDNWLMRLQVPYRTSDGGTLDSVIDEWHSLFGFPDGDRPVLPQDAFRVDYERDGESAASYAHGVSGVGDISATAAYQLDTAPLHATSIAFTLKAPTGSSESLTGSGATDATLSIAHEQVLSSRWIAYAQVNAAYLGVGELLPEQQRNSLFSGMLAFDYRYSTAFTVTLQLDGHTAAFDDSQLELLGSAWILTVGGDYHWRSGWRAQFGVSEDVKVEASPDVNFVFSVGKEWK